VAGRRRFRGELWGLAIDWLDPGVWRVLWAVGLWVVEVVEGSGNVAWHGDIAGASTVVPTDGEATIAGATHVDADGVVLA
jgi:hypothetical protein